MTDQMFKWAAEYAALGWHVVACHGAKGKTCVCYKGDRCNTPGKHPVMNDWPNNTTVDEEVLAEWFDGSKVRNLGVQLGPKSGIIDIEYDSDEGRRTAERFGLDQCYTPTYTSKRSTHRLFKYDDRLPQKGDIEIDGLEIRIGGGDKGTQSIMPPSSHASGVSYAWVDGMSPGEVDVAEIPRELMIAIANESEGGGCKKVEKPATTILHTKASEGGRHHALVRLAALLCIKMIDQHDAYEQQTVLMQLHAINRTQCTPPKPDDEVDSIFHYAIRWAVNERTKNGVSTDDDKKAALARLDDGDGDGDSDGEEFTRAYTLVGLEYRDDEWWPGEWKLTVIHGDPPMYTLKIPVYRQAGDADIKAYADVQMTAETYRSSAKVAHAILEATHNVIVDAVPEEWSLIWNGRGRRRDRRAIRGLKAKLMDTSTEEAASAENCRYVAVAGWLLDVLSMAPKPDDDDDGIHEADPTGLPAWVRGADGEWELWFGWNKAWEVVDRGRRKLENGDMIRCRRMIEKAAGGQLPFAVRPGDSGHRRRFTVFRDEHIRIVEQIAAGEHDVSAHKPRVENENANAQKVVKT